MRDLDTLFRELAQSTFRQRFRLNERDSAYLIRHGHAAIRRHAERFVAQRLAPARPTNDGQQTPMRHHPVFVAQHATASCCRNCLAKWHGIPADRVLLINEQSYICDVIMAWLAGQHAPDAVPAGQQFELF